VVGDGKQGWVWGEHDNGGCGKEQPLVVYTEIMGTLSLKLKYSLELHRDIPSKVYAFYIM